MMGRRTCWFLLVAWSVNASMADTPATDAPSADTLGTDIATTEVLELRLKETPQPNYGAAVPERINGHVRLRSNGAVSGIKGVSVTDGYSVVKSDTHGAYSITPHDQAVFVYVTRPSGKDVLGDWYKPLAPEVNFTLRPAAEDEHEFTFVHVTDTHVSTNPRSKAGLSQFVREINHLIPKPRFVVNSGDLLNLSKALVTSPEVGRADFRNYVGIMNHLTMPHYNVAGDHTDSSYRINEFPRGDHRCGKPLYWEHLGPNFFSFEYGKIHFLSVDFGYHLGQRQQIVNGQELEYPTLQVQPMHTEWMQNDMANRSPGSFVVTTAEHDLTEHCPGFLQMAKLHDVRLQLVGDHHIVACKSRPVPYRVGGALAGCWWNPKAQQLCPDLSPQGYLIYRVTGEKLDCFYKGLGQRVAIISHRVGAVWTDRVDVRADLVQPEPDETLEYSLDGAEWKPMREVARPFYRTQFSASIDTTSLHDGRLSFRVKSSVTGEVRSREFVVVNQDTTSLFQSDAILNLSVGDDTGWTTHRPPAGKVDVLFNRKVIGMLEPNARKEYSFSIASADLAVANTLAFRFVESGDGMSVGSPVLTFRGKEFRDPRDEAIRQVRTAHWGDAAVDWGGFIVGDAQPPDETPFHRQQDVFCFVLPSQE